METILMFIIGGVVLSVVLVLVRAIQGPTRYDRMMAANVFGTKTMILTALLALVMDEPMFVDIALVYAMINFVTTIAMLKYTKDKDNIGKFSAWK